MGRGGNEVIPPELEEITRWGGKIEKKLLRETLFCGNLLYCRRRRAQEELKHQEELQKKEDDKKKANDGEKTKKEHKVEVKYPGYIQSTLTFLAVFIMGATIRGEKNCFFHKTYCLIELLVIFT